MPHDPNVAFEAAGPLDKTVAALARCSFLPGHPHKRFARDIAARPVEQLSPKQIAYALALAYRYRRQMPTALIPRKIERTLPLGR